ELAEGLAEGRPLPLERLGKTQLHPAVSRKGYLDLDIDPTRGDDWQAVAAPGRGGRGPTPRHPDSGRPRRPRPVADPGRGPEGRAGTGDGGGGWGGTF